MADRGGYRAVALVGTEATESTEPAGFDLDYSLSSPFYVDHDAVPSRPLVATPSSRISKASKNARSPPRTPSLISAQWIKDKALAEEKETEEETEDEEEDWRRMYRTQKLVYHKQVDESPGAPVPVRADPMHLLLPDGDIAIGAPPKADEEPVHALTRRLVYSQPTGDMDTARARMSRLVTVLLFPANLAFTLMQSRAESYQHLSLYVLDIAYSCVFMLVGVALTRFRPRLLAYISPVFLLEIILWLLQLAVNEVDGIDNSMISGAHIFLKLYLCYFIGLVQSRASYSWFYVNDPDARR